MSDQLTRLLRIMATLRDPVNGCEWDRAQRFENDRSAHHRRSLRSRRRGRTRRSPRHPRRTRRLVVPGDLPGAHCRGSRPLRFRRRRALDFGQARSAPSAHLRPEEFRAEAPGEARDERWEALKAAERAAKGATSALAGVARALPALLRAEKLQKRAAREGFDWPDTQGPADKLAEEIAELAQSDEAGRLEEAGDLLFAAVNLVRAYGIKAEDALRAANDKFERRYRAMEELAGGDSRRSRSTSRKRCGCGSRRRNNHLDPPCSCTTGMGRWHSPQANDGGVRSPRYPSTPSLRLGGPPPHSAAPNREDFKVKQTGLVRAGSA